MKLGTNCGNCKGHAHYHGGIMDGHTQHKVTATESDFPRCVGSILFNGQRSWYLRDDNASSGTEYVYRCVALAREMPEACR